MSTSSSWDEAPHSSCLVAKLSKYCRTCWGAVGGGRQLVQHPVACPVSAGTQWCITAPLREETELQPGMNHDGCSWPGVSGGQSLAVLLPNQHQLQHQHQHQHWHQPHSQRDTTAGSNPDRRAAGVWKEQLHPPAHGQSRSPPSCVTNCPLMLLNRQGLRISFKTERPNCYSAQTSSCFDITPRSAFFLVTL